MDQNTDNSVQQPQTQQPVEKETDGLAIASLVLGILSLICLGIFAAVPGIFCGHIGLSRIKNSNGAKDGRGMCIAGLIMSYVSLLVSVAVIVIVAIPMLIAIFAAAASAH